jgi:parallel beta helix pectate lyase-like protein
VLGSAFTASARADTIGPITFEPTTYTAGDINQNGWMKTGPYDVDVASVSAFPAAAGYGFGTQSLRVSDAFTSGAFGDQTFSPKLTSPAGESGLSHFDASFRIGTTLATQQLGLDMSVSPDDGNGSRTSYLRFEDHADGVHVFFVDVTNPGPLDTVASFDTIEIATLDRASAHTIRFSIDFVTGPANDVVNIYVDGVLKGAGTTWEDYYRYDPEQSANSHVVPSVSRLLFREGGTAHANVGKGFLVDNVTLASSATTSACAFSISAPSTMTLLADCETDHTILVPNGFTLNGAGNTITAVDPVGDHFRGAVVMNGGTAANVTDIEITAFGLANNVCDDGVERLRGILFDNASGTISYVNVHGVRQGLSGCQEGNAIEVRNYPGSTMLSVTIDHNIVSDYQKNGITLTGKVNGTVTNNTVTGDGPIDYIAQNGIQVGFGASALVRGNSVSGNYYTPTSWTACGLLFYEATGVKQQANTLFANEVNLCNFGRGGGKGNPSS